MTRHVSPQTRTVDHGDGTGTRTTFDADGTVIDRDALRSVGFGVRRQPAVRVDRAADTKTVEVNESMDSRDACEHLQGSFR